MTSRDQPDRRTQAIGRPRAHSVIPGIITRIVSRIANAGIAAYPPDIQRRLKIVNMIAALIIVTTLVYAAQQTSINFEVMRPVIYINIAIAMAMLLVFQAHRINDVAGGLIIVVTEFIALLAISRYLGHRGGVQVHYIIAAAAPFVVFGLQRMWLVVLIVAAALALHLYSWFHFGDEAALLKIEPNLLDSNYVQAAVTTFGLIAASVYYAFSMAEKAKAETDAVLRNVLPDSIVERLKTRPGEAIADGFSSASVLFADIAGFVALARQLGPERTVDLLSRLVSAFDDLAQQHGVEKIKTIGDAYMVASGVPLARSDHAEVLADMALDMIATARRISNDVYVPLNIRIGLASGPMMAGVIGTRKFSYDVWGDPVNLASRLEHASTPGKILICPTSQALLAHGFELEPNAKIEIKGLGLQDTWFVVRRKR